MALHFLYQDTKDEGLVLSDDLEVDVPNAVETTRAQIKKWCKDLLEVNGLGALGLGPEVQFSHQSVRDYIRLSEVEQYLTSLAGENFHPTHTLCRLSLAHLRVALCNVASTDNFRATFQTLVDRVMYFASLYESRTGHTLRELLNRLDEFCTAALMTTPGASHWSMRLSTRIAAEFQEQTARLEFLWLAAWHGLANFIRVEMGPALNYREGCHILYVALLPQHRSTPALSRAGRLEIIRFLLSSGISPNAKLGMLPHSTVWEQFIMDQLWSDGNDFTPDEILQVVEVFLDSGADPRSRHGFQSVLTSALKNHGAFTIEHEDRFRRILSSHGISTDTTTQSEP